jgi:hypothetical protein
MNATGELTRLGLFDIRDRDSGIKGQSMDDQKENIRRPVWGPRLFFLGVVLIVTHIILVYGFKITAGTFYTVIRYGGLGIAILGWILWRILKR